MHQSVFNTIYRPLAKLQQKLGGTSLPKYMQPTFRNLTNMQRSIKTIDDEEKGQKFRK